VRRTIADVLRAENGFLLNVPEGRGWQRLPCPYCGAEGKRSPAAVNWKIGWFVCHRCGERRSAGVQQETCLRHHASATF
jgi:hypothetical protein